MNSREIFSKKKFDNNKLINAAVSSFGIDKEDILIVEESEEWLKRNDEHIIFEYKSFLDNNEDDQEYYGYHYYDIFFDKDGVLERLKDLQKELGSNVIVISK